MSQNNCIKLEEEIKIKKYEALIRKFSEYNFAENNKLNKNQIAYFLSNESQNKNFDSILLQKLFDILELNNTKTISIKEFINYYIQFDIDLKNLRNDYIKQINLAKERLNLAENPETNILGIDSKIEIEIIELCITNQIKGIKNISIELEYNNKIKEIKFNIGTKNEINNKLIFKPLSKKRLF